MNNNNNNGSNPLKLKDAKIMVLLLPKCRSHTECAQKFRQIQEKRWADRQDETGIRFFIQPYFVLFFCYCD